MPKKHKKESILKARASFLKSLKNQTITGEARCWKREDLYKDEASSFGAMKGTVVEVGDIVEPNDVEWEPNQE